MQIIVNCCVPWEGGIVMLRKPRRGWWYLPGGKANPHEPWLDAARREVLEETGLEVDDLRLRGIHLVQVAGDGAKEPVEQAIIQFSAEAVRGTLTTHSREGDIHTVEKDEIDQLPMNEGDRKMVLQTLRDMASGEDCVRFGRFRYSAEYALLEWDMKGDGRQALAGRRHGES